jgi:hypothetical protein
VHIALNIKNAFLRGMTVLQNGIFSIFNRGGSSLCGGVVAAICTYISYV